jgi:hypothetical protein
MLVSSSTPKRLTYTRFAPTTLVSFGLSCGRTTAIRELGVSGWLHIDLHRTRATVLLRRIFSSDFEWIAILLTASASC